MSGFAARLFRDTYGSDTAASDLESYIDKNFSTERQEAGILDPSAAVFVAMVDDLIIGYAHVVVRSADGRSALLNRIYVDAEWRGADWPAVFSTLLSTSSSSAALRTWN
ncbi:GNAT family N-acetyltransferase [Rhizobium leguminosarum]|uniref:GNAT family N-acetyltransferase n=1 Tax=Rhizobium leguminosarum TaxID=384 RepID=UPI001FED8E86|nr:GNAT family N-acetyltransferase [Rhizobium leguminosarum]